MRITLEEIIKGLVKTEGPIATVERFRREAEARNLFKADGTLMNYLSQQGRTPPKSGSEGKGLDYEYRQLHQLCGDLDVDVLAQRLATLMRFSDMKVDVEYRILPWRTWVPGKTLVIVLGHRKMQYTYARLNPKTDEPDPSIRYRGAGEYDIRAAQDLINILQVEFQLDMRVEFVFERSGLHWKSAVNKFKKLYKRRDVGCICSIGSPISNPLADHVARHILGETDSTKPSRRLPARFRWCVTPRGCPEAVPYLSYARKVSRDDEGIWFKKDRDQCSFPRTHDQIILEQVGQHRGPISTAGPFWDCGMLAISCHSNQPALMVAAGHGGRGTVAAVNGLSEIRNDIAFHLQADAPFLGVVRVMLRKRSRKPVDDVYVDKLWEKEAKPVRLKVSDDAAWDLSVL